MKCCFIHDTKFKKSSEGLLYTGGSYSEEIWKRYTDFFSDFTVLARCEKDIIDSEVAEKKYNFFDEKNKKFIEIKGFHSLKDRKKSKKVLEEQIKLADFFIIRLPSVIGNYAIKLAKKYKKKYMVEVVACPWDSFWNHSIKGKIYAPIITLKTKRNIKSAPYAIYVTNHFLQRRYPNKGISVNCSDVELKQLDKQ